MQPKNLLKTAASVVPGGGIVGSILDQLEGYELDQRLGYLEDQQEVTAELLALEKANRTSVPLNDWSIAAMEFSRRTAEIAVVYNGGFNGRGIAGRDMILPVAHACLIGNQDVLSCGNAFDLATDVAREREGRVIILAGLAGYGFEPKPVEEGVGLRIHRLTTKDEEKWAQLGELLHMFQPADLDMALDAATVRFRSSIWQGQEIGFVHSGEAVDVMSTIQTFSKRQFDSGYISHFKKPSRDGLKVAVTGVLSGRLLQSGSPVFNRDGELLGIISDTEHYESDAGRRAVIHTLLGLPRFTNGTMR